MTWSRHETRQSPSCAHRQAHSCSFAAHAAALALAQATARRPSHAAILLSTLRFVGVLFGCSADPEVKEVVSGNGMRTRRCMTEDSCSGGVPSSEASMWPSASAPNDSTLLQSSDSDAKAAGRDLCITTHALIGFAAAHLASWQWFTAIQAITQPWRCDPPGRHSGRLPLAGRWSYMNSALLRSRRVQGEQAYCLTLRRPPPPADPQTAAEVGAHLPEATDSTSLRASCTSSRPRYSPSLKSGASHDCT